MSEPVNDVPETPALPEDALVILPVRNAVMFPGMILPLSIGRPASIAAAQHAVRENASLGVVLQSDASVDDPGVDDLHATGTICEILRYVTTPDGTHHVVCRGQERFRILELVPGYPFLVARVTHEPEAETDTPEIQARVMQLKARAGELIELLPETPGEVRSAIATLESPPAAADFIAGIIDFKPTEKQSLLETFDIRARLDRLLQLMGERIEVLKLSRQIGERTQESITARQREHILREQLAQIRAEVDAMTARLGSDASGLI